MRQIQKISVNIVNDIYKNVKKEVCKMTELMKKAVEKIDKEMEKELSLKPFAQYIIDNLIVSDESAGKILDEKKSLKKCFDEIKAKARKRAVGNCAFVEPETVYAWIREYFGFAENPVSVQADNNITNFDIFADL